MKSKGYFIQALAILCWWIGLATRDKFYQVFAFEGVAKEVFFQFALPDLLILVGGSFWVVFRRSFFVQSLVLGAFAYAALFCLSVSLYFRSGYLGTTVMLLGLMFNVHLVFEEKLVRRNTSKNPWYILMKSLLQSAVAWFVTLFLIPVVIVSSTREEIWPNSFASSHYVAALLFMLFGSLGLFSGYVMSFRGMGTPLPTDSARELVTSGPYAVVRNPMAVAGLGQGFAVALYLESYPVAGYVLLGLFVWNTFVRPVEERDLEQYFGETFLEYKREVNCWVPRWRLR